ncbi:hypothetical protein BHE18_03700 [Rossellomorea aquimaris]|uniref:Uncharacterized protein n=1 Tax=Rossellomorea aquimaris TaxID=189382 RepID=A0A1J6W578_9BACI|nr:hypothetical protein BHE18_03700 [Rossellomorea aquimaris]
MALKETLNILNGTEMYKHFKETQFLDSKNMIPFNEAMCYGDTCEVIFSEEFNNIRAKVHHVTPAQYTDITLKPLQPLFSGEFGRIALWFDEDMFCQMNLLTILAWLDLTVVRSHSILWEIAFNLWILIAWRQKGLIPCTKES